MGRGEVGGAKGGGAEEQGRGYRGREGGGGERGGEGGGGICMSVLSLTLTERPSTGKLTGLRQYTRDGQTQTCARALQPSHDYDALVSPPQRSESSAKSAEVWAEKVRAWLRCAWRGPGGYCGCAICWARVICVWGESMHMGYDCTRGGARACMYLE